MVSDMGAVSREIAGALNTLTDRFRAENSDGLMEIG